MYWLTTLSKIESESTLILFEIVSTMDIFYDRVLSKVPLRIKTEDTILSMVERKLDDINWRQVHLLVSEIECK